MGTADLVPGVSGGTIALVLGIYERLVASIREGSSALGSLLKGDVERFRRHLNAVEWGFIVPLLVGILAAVALLATFLEHQLEVRPTIVAGVFLGLVVVSVFIAWKLLRNPTWTHVIVTALVAAGLFWGLGLADERVGSQPGVLSFFGAGALAICAMILPGISGSLMLLMIGMYEPVLGAVTDRDFTSLGVFALGAAIGLALFSQVLHWALEHHHDRVLAALIGLMAGSTRILWPWPDGVTSPTLGPVEANWPVVLIAALVGALAVLLISRSAAGAEVATVSD